MTIRALTPLFPECLYLGIDFFHRHGGDVSGGDGVRHGQQPLRRLLLAQCIGKQSLQYLRRQQARCLRCSIGQFNLNFYHAESLFTFRAFSNYRGEFTFLKVSIISSCREVTTKKIAEYRNARRQRENSPGRPRQFHRIYISAKSANATNGHKCEEWREVKTGQGR